MHVRDAMLPAPVVASPEESFRSLLSRVVESRQATAAVLDDGGRLLGLVGIHDILRKIVPHYVHLDEKLSEVMHGSYFEERIARFQDLPVRELMSTDVDSVGPDDALIKAAAIMVEHRRKILPVLDGDRFVGIITRRSLLEHVVLHALPAA